MEVSPAEWPDTIFDEIVSRCDYGIDLHTAAVRRTNYPNVRGDLTNSRVRRIAKSFGAEIIMDTKGKKGTFRREACLTGCPTIIMEGGEVWKVEPGIVETAVRGIKNVLRELDMLEGSGGKPQVSSRYQKSQNGSGLSGAASCTSMSNRGTLLRRVNR